MPCVINASQTSGLVMTSDLSGVLQLQNNGVAVPPLTVAPAFSAYANTNQTVTSATFTKVQINTKEFDTNTNYDATTNYRFTPTVAGYYQVNAQLNVTSGNTRNIVLIYKNGGAFKVGNDVQTNTANGVTVSALIYMNGSTDYLEMYGYATSGTTVQFLGGAGTTTYFQAFLARSA